MKRGSSLRFTEWPMPPISGDVLGAIMRLPRAACPRRIECLDDVDVAGAAAEVAGDGVANLVVGGLGLLLEESVAGHQHAGRAEAALQPVLLKEALLQRMELAVLFEAFDGHDLAAVGLHGEDRARLDGAAVHDDRAGAAVARVAPDVGAGEPQVLAEEVDQQQPRLDVRRMLARR